MTAPDARAPLPRQTGSSVLSMGRRSLDGSLKNRVLAGIYEAGAGTVRVEGKVPTGDAGFLEWANRGLQDFTNGAATSSWLRTPGGR